MSHSAPYRLSGMKSEIKIHLASCQTRHSIPSAATHRTYPLEFTMAESAPSTSRNHSQPPQEVRLPNRLSPGISRTLRNLRPLLNALSRQGKNIFRPFTVILRRRDIRSMMMNRDLRRQRRRSRSHFLLVAFPLFLIQSWKVSALAYSHHNHPQSNWRKEEITYC